jgi:ATP-dependent DNA helicase PIF1
MTQEQALDILKQGHNVYITGPAGSGKTYLLNKYIEYLKGHEDEVGVTASTGIAATHMGGVTIHSWTGLGIRHILSPYDLEALVEKKYLKKRMAKVKVLIIDEVSMLHHFRLDLIDEILQTFKNTDKSFGGVQVVLCGDFFQLPPVTRTGEDPAQFVYHSNAWKNANLKICYLEEQFRQTDDAALKVLNAIRGNVVTDEIRAHLDATLKENKKETIDIIPTRLYTHNENVDEVNAQELEKIEGTMRRFEMTSRGNPVLVSILKKSCLAPETLSLKKGARVMFVKNNFDKGYVNGTLGEVMALQGEGYGPKVRIWRTGEQIELDRESWKIEEDGTVKAEISQYPLRLAWAITVHKSQGMSLDAVEVDLSRSFEPGMGYVALSRVRTLAGLTILGMNEDALKVNNEVLEFDELLKEKSKEVVAELQKISPAELKKKQEAFYKTFEQTLKAKEKSMPSHKITGEFVSEGLSIEEISKKRAMTEQTVIGHLEKLVEEDPFFLEEMMHIRKAIPYRHFEEISKAILATYEEIKDWKLAPVKSYLDKNKKTLRLSPTPGYRDIQLVRIFVKADMLKS